MTGAASGSFETVIFGDTSGCERTFDEARAGGGYEGKLGVDFCIVVECAGSRM